jgi:hypothetical protein
MEGRRKEEGKGRDVVHRPLKRKEFRTRLQDGEPTAISFLPIETDYMTWSYAYVKTVRFFVIDYDVKLDHIKPEQVPMAKAAIWDAIEWINQRLVNAGFVPGLTHSGSKGYHHWILFADEVPLGFLLGFFTEIVNGLPGFVGNNTKWELRDESGQVVAEVDSLYASHNDGKIVKLPFSQHQDKEGYWELPIQLADLRSYEPIENPLAHELRPHVDTMLYDWKVHPTEFVTERYPQLGIRGRPNRKTRREFQDREELDDIVVPDTAVGHEAALEQIDSWTDPSSKFYLPCFARAVEWSITRQSPFHLRTVVARLITSRGFDWETAMLYIKLRINDHKDNLNPDVLIYQTSYWNHNFDYIVKRCSTLAIENAPFECCPGPCGRANPREKAPGGDSAALLNIPDVSKKSLRVLLGEARELNVHRQYFKSTRVGGSTECVGDTIENEERLFHMVPSTKIAETDEDAFKLAKNGRSKIGAMLSGNGEACLKVKERIEQAKDDFPEFTPGLQQLDQIFKYNCRECPYYGSFLPMTPGTFLKESDMVKKQCLYTTVVHNLDSIDVLIMTHKKVHALKKAVEAAADAKYMPPGIMAAELILGWINRAHVILMDEISMMIDQPDVDLPIKIIPADPKAAAEHDLIELVEDEVRQLSEWHEDELVANMQQMVDNLVDEFRQIQEQHTGSIERYERDMDPDELRMVTKYLRRIQAYAARENKALRWLHRALIAFQERSWVVLEVPDQDAKKNLKIYTLPKFREGISEVLYGSRARLIAMDATHPLAAAQHLDQIIGAPFERVNIGDPNKSAELQRIIPWPFSITAPQLVNPSAALSSLIGDVIKLMDDLFGVDAFVIAVPSKAAARTVRDICRKRHLPKVDLMWHRGKDSVGVKNDKRIMLGLTAPYAPRDALNWIKEVLYPDILAAVEHETIWRYNRNKTEFQTLSRVKAPNFDGKGERSGYLALGQVPSEVTSMTSTNVCPPRVLALGRFDSAHWALPVLQLWYWIEHGVELAFGDLQAVSMAWSGQTDPQEIQDRLFDHPLKIDRIEQLLALLEPVRRYS